MLRAHDILYATDLCEAFHAFFEKQTPGVYNIGGGKNTAISLIETIKFLEEQLGENIAYRFGGERWGDLYYWVSDTSRAKSFLKWQPKTLPKEGIVSLMKWVKDNLEIFISK